MKTFHVTFERTVEVELSGDANEDQVKAAAVEMYNDPPSFEDVYVTEESILQ